MACVFGGLCSGKSEISFFLSELLHKNTIRINFSDEDDLKLLFQGVPHEVSLIIINEVTKEFPPTQLDKLRRLYPKTIFIFETQQYNLYDGVMLRFKADWWRNQGGNQ